MGFSVSLQTAPEFLPEEGQTCQFGPYKVTGRSYTSHDHYEEGFLYMVKSKRVSGKKGSSTWSSPNG